MSERAIIRTAAALLIGNELLSGKVEERNLAPLAAALSRIARTTRSAALCSPRWSPPALPPATRAASRRSASSPPVARKADAIASTVAAETRMFP